MNWGRKIVMLVGIAITAALGFVVWMTVVMQPVSSQGEQNTFVVEPGSSVNETIQELHDQNLIRSEFALKLVLSEVRAGSYQLSPGMSGWEISRILKEGDSQTVSVTIPEGFTQNQIAERFAQNMASDTEEFQSVIQNNDWSGDYQFTEPAPNDNLNGFLFPDTYFVDVADTPESVITRMLDNFQSKTADLDPPEGMDWYQLLNLASMVEREAQTTEDMELVASVLLNRLEMDMRLDVDATVRYVLSKWDEPLTDADLQVDSPYNTRQVSGLPPTPIANPGLRAIEAVINAPETDYLYYLTDPSGETHFAETNEQHNLNKARYLQ